MCARRKNDHQQTTEKKQNCFHNKKEYGAQGIFHRIHRNMRWHLFPAKRHKNRFSCCTQEKSLQRNPLGYQHFSHTPKTGGVVTPEDRQGHKNSEKSVFNIKKNLIAYYITSYKMSIQLYTEFGIFLRCKGKHAKLLFGKEILYQQLIHTVFHKP